MPTLKVFTAGATYMPQRIMSAMGDDRHITQARILAVAPSKAAAHRMITDRKVAGISLSDPEFRLATGNDVDALRAAGAFNAANIYVAPCTASRSDKVVRIMEDGTPEWVGRLTRSGNEFIPLETAFPNEDDQGAKPYRDTIDLAARHRDEARGLLGLIEAGIRDWRETTPSSAELAVIVDQAAKAMAAVRVMEALNEAAGD